MKQIKDPKVEYVRTKYIEGLKTYLQFKQEKTTMYLTIIFSLAALSFFLLFVIGPVLSTITHLKKELADTQVVQDKLQTKINSLRSLQQEYNQFSADIPLIQAAIPNNPFAAMLIAQIQSIAKSSNVQTTSLDISSIDYVKTGGNKPAEVSFTFNLSLSGSYNNLTSFLSSFVNFDRIVTYSGTNLTKNDDGTVGLSLTGTAFFQQ